MTVAVSQPNHEVVQALLDRPAARNAINLDMVRALIEVVGRDGVRVVILGSTSDEAFSAGVDLKLPDAERAEVSRELYRLYEMIRISEAIVIVAFSGPAVGGGAQLVAAADFRVASSDASIRFLGPGHGLAVGAWALPAQVGRGRAIDLTLGMRVLGAEEALAIGLIERIDDRPLKYAQGFGRQVTALSPSAVTAVKRITGISDPIEALRAEREHNDGWSGAIPVEPDGPPLAG